MMTKISVSMTDTLLKNLRTETVFTSHTKEIFGTIGNNGISERSSGSSSKRNKIRPTDRHVRVLKNKGMNCNKDDIKQNVNLAAGLDLLPYTKHRNPLCFLIL